MVAVVAGAGDALGERVADVADVLPGGVAVGVGAPLAQGAGGTKSVAAVRRRLTGQAPFGHTGHLPKMIEDTNYEFEWDDAKAEANLSKHGVDFMVAMSVLLDPLAMTRFDDEHSDDEERWVSVGRAGNGQLLLVVHTFAATGPNMALVRLISARVATRREREQYEQG